MRLAIVLILFHEIGMLYRSHLYHMFCLLWRNIVNAQLERDPSSKEWDEYRLWVLTWDAVFETYHFSESGNHLSESRNVQLPLEVSKNLILMNFQVVCRKDIIFSFDNGFLNSHWPIFLVMLLTERTLMTVGAILTLARLKVMAIWSRINFVFIWIKNYKVSFFLEMPSGS